MVSLIDIISRVRESIQRTIFGTRQVSEGIPEMAGGLQEEEELFPADEDLLEFDFRRKFVSGLFYCGGQKRQFFVQTFEQNSTIRESQLLDELEKVATNCSDIRENFGYSDDKVDRSIVIEEAIWPNMESGEL